MNGIQMAAQEFLPHYINNDLALPKDIKFDVGFGDFLWNIFTWTVEWSDIKYDQHAIFDFEDSKIFINKDYESPRL